ncbi:MAG: hypothetical protein NT096_14945 [Proteobacteria bacterium]|nr:hypothetical protein [Pseudomonadota bacterium]
MKAFYFKPELCDLCRKCEEACSNACKKYRSLPSSKALPHVRAFFSTKGPILRFCKQCEEPPCVDACIGESLQMGPGDFVIQDESRCIGCFMCNMVCPNAAMVPSYIHKKAFKCTKQCDFSDSAPPCVKSCDRGALTFEDVIDTTKKIRRKRMAELPRK